tara:strand:- start:2578 stop:3588 length:1011 start_codon:yes stop_codon:yes gene_type:complete
MMNNNLRESDPTPKKNELVFSGSGEEFFGIWITNILLSICTLGIYSAWAKVRTTNYFYGSTKLAGAPFSYTANPVAILKGRIFAILGFFAYSYFSQAYPGVGIFLIIVLTLFTPFIITRSLNFRLQNTEYRGLRFGFRGTTAEAYKIFLLEYLLMIITFGILFPRWEAKRKAFYVGNIHFGTSQFSSNPSIIFFYQVAGIVIVNLAIYSALFYASSTIGISEILLLLAYPVLGLAVAYWFAETTNHIFATSQLENIQFQSSLTTGGLAKLWLVNLLLITFTLGFATPWVMVRNARYRISNTNVLADNLDSFIVQETSNTSALGEEIGEAFDIDLSI